MRNALTFALLPSRVGAAVLGSMGVLGLLLASIPTVRGAVVHGEPAHSGDRCSRGAGGSRGHILGIVIGPGAKMLAAGTAIGMTIAVFAVRPLAMFVVPEVRPADVSNFAMVGLVLWAGALAASVSPALRALRADPAVAVRHE